MARTSLTQWGARDPSATRSTGKQLKQKDPMRYEALLRAVKEGVPRGSLVRIFGVGAETVSAIIKTEGLQADEKSAVLQEFRATRDLCLSGFKDAVQNGEVKGEKLAVPIGILSDKIAQLEGTPSQIVEHRAVLDTFDGCNALIDQCKPAKACDEGASVVLEAEEVSPNEI